MLREIPVHEAFPFIRQMLSDAFKTDTLLFGPPYENLDRIDRGFRSMVWKDSQYSRRILTLDTVSSYHFLVIRSSLCFVNLIAVVTMDEKPDFISIGPFRDENISEERLQRIIQHHRLPSAQLSAIRRFYQSLPCVETADIVTMTQHLLTAFLPGFQSVTPRYINYSENSHDFVPDEDRVGFYNMESAEVFADKIKELMKAVLSGESSLCNKPLKHLLTDMGFYSNQAVPQLREGLLMLNALCFSSLLSSSVHPVHTLKLLYHNEKLFMSTNNTAQLMRLPSDIVHKYCLLVKNYAYSDYSYLVRNVLNYISQHLGENLSLSVIAKYFKKNPSYLSAQFGRETGCSLTDYIRRERIRTSLRYMNITDLTIAEIAGKVGIADFSYFTRLFVRQIGCTPSEYRRKLKEEETRPGNPGGKTVTFELKEKDLVREKQKKTKQKKQVNLRQTEEGRQTEKRQSAEEGWQAEEQPPEDEQQK